VAGQRSNPAETVSAKGDYQPSDDQQKDNANRPLPPRSFWLALTILIRIVAVAFYVDG